MSDPDLLIRLPQVVVVSHWVFSPIGVRSEGVMGAAWHRGAGPMPTWNRARVGAWAADTGLSSVIQHNLRAGQVDGQALADLTPKGVWEVRL
jgi:hypothetical protein